MSAESVVDDIVMIKHNVNTLLHYTHVEEWANVYRCGRDDYQLLIHKSINVPGMYSIYGRGGSRRCECTPGYKANTWY